MVDPGLFSLVRELCKRQLSVVLATKEEEQPYVSLMAFAATPDLKTIIMATDRHTRKYASLMAEPRVALLIDNRSNTPADTQEAVAITVLGKAAEATPEERKELLPLFLERHPQLEVFATSPTCALIAVRVATYVVVQRFAEVREMRMV